MNIIAQRTYFSDPHSASGGVNHPIVSSVAVAERAAPDFPAVAAVEQSRVKANGHSDGLRGVDRFFEGLWDELVSELLEY